ncbi:MAG: YebC/PmpR family DNA-binding transcriptional regulator [Hymenobacteraceae bacterium]|nr:YebC/PmpR family DNA-binding transcriptional regulator [Hymenobacteraceae bacterium]
MGRAFEFRKGRKMKRWAAMSKAFTRISKELTIAAKEAGPNPDSNFRLKTAMQNAKGVNMPKEKVEGAIKRATEKGAKDYTEMVYEGYGPHGIAILIESATDNPTRTVAAVRMHLSRAEGELGKTGSLNHIFERKGVFRLPAEGLNLEDLELELIDFGADEIFEDEGEIIIHTAFTDFGSMLKALEARGITVTNSELQRLPLSTVEITDEQYEDIEALVEKIEEDDDVQAVYHNAA